MKITRLILKKFKPTMHCGVDFVDIGIDKDTCIMIGKNGSGKSMILSELTPIPAVKTMYEKKGMKQIYIDHGNSSYILTSDFTTTTNNHSFVKNNEELNISKNQPVQLDLIAKEFQLTPLMSSIIDFSNKVCTMTRNQRRDLIMSLYPNDLSFILQKHKVTASKMRELKANLKMLQQRKADLKNKLLSKDNLNELTKLKEELLAGNTAMDKIIFICDNEIDSLSNEQRQLTVPIYDAMDYYDTLKNEWNNTKVISLAGNVDNWSKEYDELRLTTIHKQELANCYRSCLDLAFNNN